MKHIYGLDPLRGIAALSIVFLHFTSYLTADIGILISKQTTLVTNFYLFVDLFFILSGYVLTHNYLKDFSKKIQLNDYIHFMKKRFLRIYPLHFVTLFILVGLHWGVFNYFTAHIEDSLFIFRNKFSLLTNLFLIQSMGIKDNGCFNCTSWNYPAWSISVEWLTYFLVPIYIYFISKFKRLSLALVSIGLLVLYWKVEKPIGHLDVASYYGWYRCIIEIFLGSLLYRLTYSKWKTKPLLLRLALFLIIPLFHFNQIAIFTVLFFGLLIVLVGNSEKTILLDNKVFIWLGKRSYSIYLIHVIVQDITSYIFRYFGGIEVRDLNLNLQFMLILFLGLLVILMSHFSYNLIELKLYKKIKLLIKA